MTPDLDTLERQALAATPGHTYTLFLTDQTDHCHYCHLPPDDHDAMRVDPATILSLIATTRRLEAAAEAVWDHWENGIGWFDGYDGTTNGTDYHLTQMTVEDDEEMDRRMDILRAALAGQPGGGE